MANSFMLRRVATTRCSRFCVRCSRVHHAPRRARAIDAVHAAGGHFGVVSGGFEEVVTRGLPRHVDLRREAGWRSETLTSRVLGRIVTSQVKVSATVSGRLGVPMARTVQSGSRANDIPMMDRRGRDRLRSPLTVRERVVPPSIA